MEISNAVCSASENLNAMLNVESLPAVFEIDSFQTTTAQQPPSKPTLYKVTHCRVNKVNWLVNFRIS